MVCANPHCRNSADDAEGGTLRFVEMEVLPEERTIRSDSGFPICSVPGKFFWLCANCAVVLKIRRWTRAGLVFEENGESGRTDFWTVSPKIPVQRAEPGAGYPKTASKAAYLGS